MIPKQLCDCGEKMVTRKEWLGPDSIPLLPYSFLVVTRCPKRHILNFWNHSRPIRQEPGEVTVEEYEYIEYA